MKRRVPSELLLRWIAAVRETTLTERHALDRECVDFIARLEKNAWTHWMRHDLEARVVKNYFDGLHGVCSDKGLFRLAKLAALYGEMLSHTLLSLQDDSQEAEFFTLLSQEYYGRRFESVLMKNILDDVPLAVCENAVEVAAFLAYNISLLPPEKRREAMVIFKKKLIKRWDWKSSPAQNDPFKNIFDDDYDPDAIYKNVLTYLSSSMRDARSVMLLPDVAYRVQGCINQAYPDDIPNYFQWVRSVRTYRWDVKRDLCVNEEADGAGSESETPGIYKNYLDPARAQAHTKNALYHGVPYVRGFSGHTIALLHLSAAARQKKYRVDPRYVLLLVMLWGVNKGRHATYGILLTADHLNEPLALNLGSLGRDALTLSEKKRRIDNYRLLVSSSNEAVKQQAAEQLKMSVMQGGFIPDLKSFFDGFSDERTRAAIARAVAYAEEDVLDALASHDSAA